MVSFKDDRRLWDKEMKKALNGGVGVVVGFLSDGATHGEGASVVEVATYMEFGTKNAPERSFLRSTFEDKQEEWINDVNQYFLRGKGSLERLGLKMQRDVRKKIVDLQDPPLKAATIRKKGSSNPLIDTGKMRQSVNYKVRKL